MTTLLTGGNGFVGSALLRLLLAQGERVRVLVRPGADLQNLAGLDVETVEGDLSEPDSLPKAVRSCNTVFHVAADYRLWVPDPRTMYRSNVEGTRALMLAALDACVQRVVYTSSVATLGLRAEGAPADEDTPVALDNMVGHYKRSKFLAEQEVRGLVRERQLPAVIVNPSTPMGPRDIKPTPTGRVVRDAMLGRIPAYVDTGLNIVHVEDVAKGHLLALQKGRIGERYILGGDNMSLRDILWQVCNAAGRCPPAVRLPHSLLLPVAWCMERISGLTGQPPRATVDEIRMARKRMYFTSARAEQQLGYQHRPGVEAIADAVRWFSEHGIPPRGS